MTSRTNITRILPLLIILISSLLIFYQFPALPQNLSFDELEFAKLALSLQNQPYTPYSDLATGHSTLYFYILLASLQTFGITTFALRLPAAIFGVINVVLTYLLMRQVFDHFTEKKDTWVRIMLPTALSLALLTMHWYFNFTRYSFEATFMLCLELISLIYVFHFQKSYQHIYLIASGIFAGLAYLSYTPGRLFFLIPLAFLTYLLRKKISTIIYFLIPFILLVLPLNTYLLQNPDIRIQQLSYVNNNSLTVSEKIDYFTRNVLSTAGMFHFKGDLNGRQNYPGKPALNPILGVFFLLGLLISLKERRSLDLFFLFYFVVSIFPALMTYPQENPHMLRTFTAVIPIIYFIGRSILQQSEIKKIKKEYFWIAIILLLSLSTVYELRTYFYYQAQVFPDAFEMKGPLKELIEM